MHALQSKPLFLAPGVVNIDHRRSLSLHRTGPPCSVKPSRLRVRGWAPAEVPKI